MTLRFIIIVLLYIPLYSKDNDTSKLFTKDELLLYNKSINYFIGKEYKNAFLGFDTLLNKHISNNKLNFYYGRTTHELKKFNLAFAAYQRILIMDENNIRVRLEMARILYDMHLYEKSLKEFQALLLQPIPQTVRKNIELIIKKILSSKKGYKFSKLFLFSIGYDNNINNINNTTYENFTTYGSIYLNNDTNKISDIYYKFIITSNLLYPIKSTSWIYENNLLFYNQSFKDNSNNNISLIALSNGLSFPTSKYKYLFEFINNKVWYDSKELYQSIGVTNSLTYLFNKNLIFKSQLKYTHKSMSKVEEYEKDTTLKYLSTEVIKVLNQKSSIILKTYHSKERKIRGERIDLNKDIYGLGVSYLVGFTSTLSSSIAYNFDKYKYLDKDFVLPNREDNRYTYTISLSKQIDNKNIIKVVASNINAKSNIEINRYKKSSLELQYIKKF